MGFEKKEVIESMSIEEQLKGKVAFYRIFIGVLMIVEFGTALWYVANVMESKEITSIGSQIAWILQYCFFVLLIVLLIDLQSMSFYGGSLLFDKTSKDKGSAIGWAFLYVALSTAIVYGDMEGAKHGGKKHFGYVPQKVEDYNKDAKFKDKGDYRSRLEKEKQANLEKYEASLKSCIPCNAIKGNYAAKIAEKSRGIRHSNKPQDANWISNINRGVKAEINALEVKRDAEVAMAKAKIEATRDSIDGLFVSRINAADTSIAALTSNIDKFNDNEDLKKDLKDKQIDSFAVGVAPFTQALLFILRVLLIGAFTASGYTWHGAGTALRAMSIMSSIRQWFDIHTYETIEKGKINRTSKLATVIGNVESHIDNVGTSDHVEKVRLLLENNAQTPLAAKALLVKKKEVTQTSTPSVPVNEADYYRDIIDTFTLFYIDSEDTDPQKTYYKDIIDTFTLFLNDLK